MRKKPKQIFFTDFLSHADSHMALTVALKSENQGNHFLSNQGANQKPSQSTPSKIKPSPWAPSNWLEKGRRLIEGTHLVLGEMLGNSFIP